MSQEFELKLSDGKVVIWDGVDGVDASQRYADAHPGAVVIGWRYANRHRVHIGVLPIIEP